ncbi:GumC family protein [Flagellimonas profundi]|uniref:non-specific protein-tyrosine kinase n=1 Tax=Flagellimonas profundi TaxID=2915620 RepID=A0ABS3FCU8_9FLAO|nr:polysaccharide biosynthesis tyrosine autokinase [Allomuricauda profundi]MBO0340540.1 polysaccharide biosynthesis tyrosine autokinase [Allomuricauda profundi]
MNNSDFDLKALINKYLKNWHWFAIAVVIALVLAFLKLRYTTPKYQLNAKIQVVEENNSVSELSVLKDLNVFSGKGSTEMSDEIELLKSRDNFIKVVQKLKLNVSYQLLGNLRNTGIYPNYPVAINFLAEDSIQNKSEFSFYIKILNENEFTYAVEEDAAEKRIPFGSNIKTNVIGDIIITPNIEYLNRFLNQNILVTIRPVPFVAQIYRTNVEVSTVDEFSRIMNISLQDAIPQRGIDVLNALIQQNNENEIQDKKTIADRTSQFINDRIADIYSDLSSVEETAETFKESRGIADLASQSSVNFQQSAASEAELQNANIQLNIASSMQNMLSEQEGYEIIPNAGLTDPSIDNIATRYNELVARRNRLLESSNERNPVIVELDQQLESLKRGMQSSLNNVTNNLNLRVNSLSKQLSQINSRIYATPGAERALRNISREQQTTEGLYIYLLQKREEAQIAFASASPKARIVDNAYLANPLPVEPKRMITYLAALILGLIVPFSVIYVKDQLDNKVHNKLDLEHIAGDIPVIVEIPKLGKKDTRLVKKEDRSVLAESLRILRTNLNYIQKSHKSTFNNIIFITSSVPGEGKTLLSSNLAAIYANTGKKVLLIGADIRNPKLYDFFTTDDMVKTDKMKPRRSTKDGLTEYLVNSKLTIHDITNPAQVNENSIDIIFSGKIPPNPSELLMKDRMGDLFERASELYDYVIVDTAPLMVVTDTLLISEYASQILYVVKANSTEKKVLDFPVKLKAEGKLKGLSFVVNNVKQNNLGYGGKYGYGYGKSTKKWWKFA